MLEAEKKDLLTDLHVAKSPLNNVKDNKIVSELVRLLNLTDKYDAEIQSEKLQVIHFFDWFIQEPQVMCYNTANNLVHSYCSSYSEEGHDLRVSVNRTPLAEKESGERGV